MISLVYKENKEMTAITSDLYFTNIRVLPTAINAMVCKSWNSHIIKILKKQKQTFYELQIYNLIVNKYSDYPFKGYKVRRRIDFTDCNPTYSNNNIYEDNLFNIAYDNMIKQIFNYLRADKEVYLNIRESIILYYSKYISIYHRNCRAELLDILDKEFIDKDIACEYKDILLKYYGYEIT